MTTPLEDDSARLATLLADTCTYATQMLAGMATRSVTGSVPAPAHAPLPERGIGLTAALATRSSSWPTSAR